MCLVLESCEAYFSEKGHNGFFYPKKSKKVHLPKGTTAKALPWIPMYNLMAIKVEKKNVFDLIQSDIPGKFVVLWVEKNLIKRALNESDTSRPYFK